MSDQTEARAAVVQAAKTWVAATQKASRSDPRRSASEWARIMLEYEDTHKALRAAVAALLEQEAGE